MFKIYIEVFLFFVKHNFNVAMYFTFHIELEHSNGINARSNIRLVSYMVHLSEYSYVL